MPKQVKPSKPKQKKQTQLVNEPLPIHNRFTFPSLSNSQLDFDTESETAAEDDDFLSVTSTPNTDSQADLFLRPPPGTFDFAKGSVNPRKASLRKKNIKKRSQQSESSHTFW